MNGPPHHTSSPPSFDHRSIHHYNHHHSDTTPFAKASYQQHPSTTLSLAQRAWDMTNPYPTGSPGVPDLSMPTGAPGFAPRRSSYASVVSGVTPATSQSYLQPTRAGAFAHLLNHPNDFSADPTYQYLGRLPYDSRVYDIDFGANGSVHGRSSSWGRSGHLPSFSQAFSTIMDGEGYAGLGHADHFFIPSYLKGSKYIQRLEESHKARLRAQKEEPQAQSSQSGSLSTSASSLNLHTKLAPSHRGMTYDIIEKALPVEDETVPRLPSRWSSTDKYGGLEVLSDGQEVKFTGPKSDRDRDHEACSIRADYPMPTQCGIYYYEVTIISRKREESTVGVGFSSKSAPLSRVPGWEPESWAYHGDDGHSYGGQSSGKHYGPPFAATDVIGCGVNFRTGCAFFTKNGDFLSNAFREIKSNIKLFPSVGMKKPGEHVRINFGQTPFVFDIDGMMVEEKRRIRLEIECTSTAKLAPPMNETDLIQSLVLQYLTHNGHTETAKAFANEVYAEKKALTIDPHVEVQGFDVKEDEDAGHRQGIRKAVSEGDIEKALKYTNAFYPQVLKDNEHVYFRLRIRRFIEMIRQGAEMQRSWSTNGIKKSNGHGPAYHYDEYVGHDMEIDDQQNQNNNHDRMETEGLPIDNEAKYQQLIQDTLIYGQALDAEFKNDPRREVKKALQDAFALMAYKDPFTESSLAYLLDISGREAVADELNSAILSSLGKSSSTALEQLYQQTSVLLDDLRDSGGPGAFVNIDDYAKIH
ncbi:Ran-binding protein [Lachnellula hyalina]|uniref:Ran-binding protein n=1 Tax=Lachnellula hyalina TaxID=1316788 RepID=A0A8H8RCZ0_9HELO|nr:Ran-binding protein [Lachnellula hyalina]TVY31087.1 Ran-binding protein [Lachnellula hyalina]